MADQRIEKWRRWLESHIKPNVLQAHLHRHVWREVTALLRDNDNLPESYWWEFMFETYASTQAMTVRRIADVHKDSASLARLIAEIGDDPTRIARDWWIGLWKPDATFASQADQAWARSFAGTTDTHLDPAIPAADLDQLLRAAERVKDHVDQHLAHTDPKPVPATVTLGINDVHDVIDTIGRLFQKYNNLLAASTYYTLVPILPEGDWMRVFRAPWARPTQ